VGGLPGSSAQPARRGGAGEESRPGPGRGARRPLPRRAERHALAVLPADRLPRRREPEPRERQRPDADPGRGRPRLLALPGGARRLLADRPLRPSAPPGRRRAGAGVRDRAGAARRGALGGDEHRHGLHCAPRARPAARDRARDRGELRRVAQDLRAALRGRRGVRARALAGGIAVPAGAGRGAGLRAPGRAAGEPALGSARAQSRRHPARQGHRRAHRSRDPGRAARRPPRAAAGHPAGRGEPARRKRQHRRGEGALLPVVLADGPARAAEHLPGRLRQELVHHRRARRRPHRADLHLRRHLRPGVERGSRAARGARLLPAGGAERLPRDERRAGRCAEAPRGARGAQPARQGAAHLRQALARQVRRRALQLHRGAVRGERAVRRRADRGGVARPAPRRGRQRLQGARGWMGRRGWVDAADPLAPQPQDLPKEETKQ